MKLAKTRIHQAISTDTNLIKKFLLQFIIFYNFYNLSLFFYQEICILLITVFLDVSHLFTC